MRTVLKSDSRAISCPNIAAQIALLTLSWGGGGGGILCTLHGGGGGGGGGCQANLPCHISRSLHMLRP